MDNVTLDTFLAAIARHALTTFGGAIVAAGYAGSATTQEIAGAGMVFFGIALSWWNKRGYAMMMSELHFLQGRKVNPLPADAPK